MAQWFRWFPGDYLRDTGALSLTENGAYRVLLDHYYSTGGKLKADMVQLFRICRAIEEEERNAVGRVVRDFFTVDEDGWLRNKRADREIAEMAEFHKSRSDAGRKGNAKRWGSHSESPSDRTAIRERSHEDRQPQPQESKEGAKSPRPEMDFIFRDGLGALCEQGHTEPAARAVLGKLVKDFGEKQVASALTAAMGKADVKSYAMAILRGEQKAAAESKVRRLAL